jgi:hypothetical protein
MQVSLDRSQSIVRATIGQLFVTTRPEPGSMVRMRQLANISQIAQKPRPVRFRARFGDEDIVWLHIVVTQPSAIQKLKRCQHFFEPGSEASVQSPYRHFTIRSALRYGLCQCLQSASFHEWRDQMPPCLLSR